MYRVYVSTASLEEVPGGLAFVTEVLHGFVPKEMEGVSALVLPAGRRIFDVKPPACENGIAVYIVTATGGNGSGSINDDDTALMERVSILEQAGVNVTAAHGIGDGRLHYMTRRLL
ncbi:hypothetical protein HYU15_02070 [Candidatus Woesearchaeota archaeon]|nr:hypothetical protein [Candidatus Woesearchaeota archaeon]